MHNIPKPNRLVIRLAGPRDREEIYRLRHEVYAHELGQHSPNAGGRLSDPLDDFNVYIVAGYDDEIAGFITSIRSCSTPCSGWFMSVRAGAAAGPPSLNSLPWRKNSACCCS